MVYVQSFQRRHLPSIAEVIGSLENKLIELGAAAVYSNHHPHTYEGLYEFIGNGAVLARLVQDSTSRFMWHERVSIRKEVDGAIMYIGFDEASGLYKRLIDEVDTTLRVF